MPKMKKFVISLGGSLLYPENIDISFIISFKSLVESCLKKDYSFVFVCGGGKLARDFQKAAEQITTLADKEKDWLGIAATKMNASLIKSIFGDKAYEKVISDPTEKIYTNKPIIVCSGWKPGRSTDYDSVLMANNIGTDTVINMSNIDYVYDSDPKKNPKAEKLKNISWNSLRKLVGSEWKPGLSMPFDPIAAKEAEKNGLRVIIIGRDLENLKKVLDGKEFEGTIIE